MIVLYFVSMLYLLVRFTNKSLPTTDCVLGSNVDWLKMLAKKFLLIFMELMHLRAMVY